MTVGVRAVVLGCGGFFFRWRSYLPLILAPLLAVAVVRSQHETGAFDLDPVWTVTAVVGGVLFVVLRFLKKRTSMLAVRRAAPLAERPPRH